MPEDRQILVAASELLAAIARVYQAKGMNEADARAAADVMVWADMRGMSSHGVQRLPMFLRILDSGELDPKFA